MKKHSKNKKLHPSRPQSRLLAVIPVLLAASLIAISPAFVPPTSAAQVTSRSIELSDSRASSTNVTYHVAFTTGTTAVIQGIVVDFCDNDPLIGDSCTAPGGFTVGSTPTFANLSGTNPTTGWSATQLNSGRTFVLTNGSGASVNSATAVSFDITSVTNPNTTNHSFYARVLTYTTSAGATGYIAGSEGSPTDIGGIALSTASAITITARIEEQLSFCVFNATCGDSPAITLGHGPNNVLDSTAVDTNTDQFSVSTNAQGGVDVRMKGGALTSGSSTIPGVSPSPGTITAGTAAFGLHISSNGTGMSSPPAEYAGAGGTYGFNTANLASTFGDTIDSSTGFLNNSVSAVTFAATASNTTPAGIYTATEQLIATGTF